MRLIKKIGINNIFINFIFQRIFRRNSKVSDSVNFTSTVTGIDLLYSRDLNTLASLALSGGCYLQAINGIVLGENILFGPGIKIISSNHDATSSRVSVACSPVEIGNNVWIGANAIILPGVTIGNGCTIGAGSVVTKSFKNDNLIIAGNPAKVIKELVSK